MNQWFGLGIALELRDNLSRGLATAQSTFERFRNSTQRGVQDIKTQIDALNSLQLGGAFLSENGEMIKGLGTSLLNPVVDLGKKVVTTSSQFEQWRMTLKALYKDADVANEKLAWGLKLAASTPFDMADVTQALIGFKAVGAESDTVFKNANGEARTFLEYMGDLAALRPDVGLDGVLMGVRNLLGGDGGRSLTMRMDIDLENILGREFGDTTDQIMQDLVEASDKLAGGLMKELEGTWGHLTGNLQDQAERLFLAIGDNGAFDMFKDALRGFSNIIDDIDDEKMAKIGTNIAKAFKLIWSPLNLVIKGVQTVFKWVIKLAESNSVFSSLVLGVTTFVGSILALSGVMLTFGGGLIQTISSLGLFLLMLQNSSNKFTNILSAFKTLSRNIIPMIALMGALALAWRTDFMGVRTTMTNFTNTLKTSWSEAKRISSLGVSDMLAELNKLDTTTFGGWLTYNLVRLGVLWKALCEAWNTNELSDETFQKVQALGLLPLVSAILDLKQRAKSFFKGFKEGWENVSSVVSKVINFIGEKIGELIAWLFPVKDSVDSVSDSVGGINITKWEKFGEVTAYIVSILGGLWVVSKVVGVFNKVAGVVSTITGAFSTISGLFSTVGTTILGVFSKIAGGVSTLIGWIGGFFGVIGGLVTTILGAFGIVVTLPAWVVGAITVAIVTIIALIIAFWDDIVAGGKWCWDKLCEGVSAFIDWCVNGWSKICEGASWLWDKLCEGVSGFGDWCSSIWDGICQGAEWLWDKICEGASWLWQTICDLAQPVITFFQGMGQILIGIFQIAWSIISNLAIICWNVIKIAVGLVWEGIKVIVKGAYNFITTIWNGITTFFQTIWNFVYQNVILPIWNGITSFIQTAYTNIMTIWNGVKAVFSTIWNYVLNNIILPVWNAITSFIQNAYNGVVTIWNGVQSVFSTIWNYVYNNVIMPVWNFIVTFITNAYNGIVQLWNGITTVFSTIWNFIYNSVILPVWNLIVTFITNAYNGIVNIWNGAMSFFQTIWNFVLNNVITPIWTGIKTTIQTAYTFVTEVWNAITSFFSTIWNAVLSVVSTVWSGIKNLAQTTFSGVSTIWNGLTGVFSKLWSKVKTDASAFFSWLSSKFSWVADSFSAIADAWSGIKDGVSAGWQKVKNGAGKMVGLNTGGYVKTEGVAMLHPNEVVVNDDLTQRLRTFLTENEHSDVNTNNSTVQRMIAPVINLEQPTPKVVVNIPSLESKVIPIESLRARREAQQIANTTNNVQDIINTANYDQRRSLVNNYENTRSLVNNVDTNNILNRNLTNNVYEDIVKNIATNINNSAEYDHSKRFSNDYNINKSKVNNIDTSNVLNRNLTNNFYEDIIKNLQTNINNSTNYNQSRGLVNNYDTTRSLINNADTNTILNRDFTKNIYDDNIRNLYNNVNTDNNKSVATSLSTIMNNYDRDLGDTISTNKNEYTTNSNVGDTLYNSLKNMATNTSNNTSTSTTNGNVDNSVTFSEGAIQIQLQQGTEADATKLAKMIMDKIKKEMQLRNTLNYRAN